MVKLHKAIVSILPALSLYCHRHLRCSKLQCLRGPCGQERKVASDQQAATKWGLRPSFPQGTKLCQGWCEKKASGRYFPSWAFKWDPSPGWHTDCSSVRDQEAEDPAKPSPQFWCTRTVEWPTCVVVSHWVLWTLVTQRRIMDNWCRGSRQVLNISDPWLSSL